MTEKKSYAGIDWFRVPAALLIVAIHTSPLASVSVTGDFFMTRIVARLAVPFFFMTSGFFLLPRYAHYVETVRAFIKKTCLMYLVATFLYLPVNIYSGFFKQDNLLPNLIKDIVTDGTFYHLWYLPASMLGAVTAAYLLRNRSYQKAFLITAILYMAGLFGDSYYGITEAVSWMKGGYDLIFQVTDYTRNGIFFAPIFFVLGGYISGCQDRLPLKESVVGFIVSFGLMTGEAFILHKLHVPRHDSMYLFLIPSVYFLFCILLHVRGKSSRRLRTICMLIYIVHPLVMISIRLAAKLLHMYSLVVQCSLIYYIAVSILSVMSAIVITAVWGRLKPGRKKPVPETERAWLEIDLGNLEHNARVLKEAMPDTCALMAVVKADAYGHGSCEIAARLNETGVRAFAVATVDEAIRLRKYGISGEILILGYTPPERAKDLYRYKLSQTLIDYGYSVRLDRQGYRVSTHIKLDTGMHRLGFEQENVEKIMAAFLFKNLEIRGIYTHLCASDSMEETDVRFTKRQIASFYKVVNVLKEKGFRIPYVHVQSSYGLLNYPELQCDYVRAGIALYGVLSSPSDRTKLQLDLKPVLSMKARVVLLRNIRKGESVGYSRAFTAERDSRIALLSVGYADGYPRNLSEEKGEVLLNGCRVPIVGKICMDMLTVDVTDCPGVAVGNTATLIGKDGEEEITAPVTAEKAESIANELLSRMGSRLKIIHR